MSILIQNREWPHFYFQEKYQKDITPNGEQARLKALDQNIQNNFLDTWHNFKTGYSSALLLL